METVLYSGVAELTGALGDKEDRLYVKA